MGIHFKFQYDNIICRKEETLFRINSEQDLHKFLWALMTVCWSEVVTNYIYYDINR
jgi:hypothetical protein